MRAWIAPRGCRRLDELRQVERSDLHPRSGQVLIRIRARSLNRRDHAIVTGTYFGKPVPRDLVPLSDGAGEVAAVGEGVRRFTAGDNVVAAFLQTPADGPPFDTRLSLGSPLDGTLTDQMIAYEDGLVAMPPHLSFEAAACLPCAGVTAWNALMVAGRPVSAGDTVLVLGTGGVSAFALQFAKAAGARVIATSSSDAKLDRFKAHGADDVVNYERTPAWAKEVLRLTAGRGADCVVEVGGVGTLERSIEALAEGGKIALVGVLTGRSAELNPYGLMWKTGTLHGIRVGSQATFEQMNRAIEANRITPLIDRVFSFADAPAAFHHQASGHFAGKIVIADQA
jgi:NADPH:quinone reductase-like Zn-dependent oxidoreductase